MEVSDDVAEEIESLLDSANYIIRNGEEIENIEINFVGVNEQS